MAKTNTLTTKYAALDACFIISICLKEPATFAKATAEWTAYAAAGCEFYAPGVIVSEALYVFCKKLKAGDITTAEHSQAVQAFISLMSTVNPPPNGDFSLIQRSDEIRGSYGCGRASDGIYIALAEELGSLGNAELLTFDKGMDNQAKKNAPTVKIKTIV